MELKGCACPIYMNAWCDMMSKRDKAPDNFYKLQVITAFAEEYTMLPHYWSKFLELAQKCDITVTSTNFTFLYSTKYGDKNARHIEWVYPLHIANQLRNNPTSNHFKEAENVMTFPHKGIKEIFPIYRYYSTTPMSEMADDNFRKYKKLYKKMKHNEHDIDVWLKCLDEIEDKEAVIANYELKLGQSDNWTNKNIWDAYLKFLKENNRKEILEVYRKYTRLFISDKKAVEEYRNEIEKFSMWNVPATKYWIDTIKYEMDFGDLEFAYILLQRAIKAVLGQNIRFYGNYKHDLIEPIEEWRLKMEEVEALRQRISKSENKENTENRVSTVKASVHFSKPQQPQHFCFHQSFIQQLIKSANGHTLRKLYATCKFFFAFHNVRLCYRLEITQHCQSRYSGEALYLNENFNNDAILNKLHFYSLFVCINSKNQSILSSIIQKLYSCAVRNLLISNQSISFNEFKFLLSNNLYQIYMKEILIFQDGKEVEGMSVLNFTKNATKFKYFEFYDKKNCICCSHNNDSKNRSNPLKMYRSDVCETIYIYGEEIRLIHLALLLQSPQHLKSVTLQNTSVDDVTGLFSNDIKSFVKTKVAANVIVEVC